MHFELIFYIKFIKINNRMKCNLKSNKLAIYGITQNAKTNEYLMVLQYANNGNLHKYLSTNFRELTWQIKLKLLLNISEDLCNIHDAGYIHADLHSGNILQDRRISEEMQSYISDLGLSQKYNENTSGDIYGVLPYVAPEVLSGQQFTSAADIYGFGVIMSEISTGQRPFDGCKFDINLAVKICKGLQPEFAFGTPNCYIKFAKQCMDLDPQKRPDSYKVRGKLLKWNKIMGGEYDSDDDDDETYDIKKQFLDADKIIEKLPIISPKHSNSMYTSKIISTQKILNAIKGIYFF